MGVLVTWADRIITMDRITEGPISMARVIYYSIILNISVQTGCACNDNISVRPTKEGAHLSTTVRGVHTRSSTKVWEIHAQTRTAVLQSAKKTKHWYSAPLHLASVASSSSTDMRLSNPLHQTFSLCLHFHTPPFLKVVRRKPPNCLVRRSRGWTRGRSDSKSNYIECMKKKKGDNNNNLVTNSKVARSS